MLSRLFIARADKLRAMPRILCGAGAMVGLGFAVPVQARSSSSWQDTALLSVAAEAANTAKGYGRITSIFRTVEHNRKVGGVANSYHLQGRAIDIVRRPGISHRQVEAALRLAGYALIESLDEGDHSHFAFAASPGAPVPDPVQRTAEARPVHRLLADDHGTLSVSSPSSTGSVDAVVASASQHGPTDAGTSSVHLSPFTARDQLASRAP